MPNSPTTHHFPTQTSSGPFFRFFFFQSHRYQFSSLDLGMGHPTRTTRPNPSEKNPTRPDPSYVAGGRGPYFLTRNNQRAGHGP